MTFKQAFDETLAACQTPALKKRFCTNELKALRSELADQKKYLPGGWLHGERIDAGTIRVTELRIEYVQSCRDKVA